MIAKWRAYDTLERQWVGNSYSHKNGAAIYCEPLNKEVGYCRFEVRQYV
jgi:hypothetical protein